MTGAECLLRTLVASGVNVCFMNPGTSEMQFVSALDRVEGMRGVLGLHETVCTGAADGYARMTGRPAAALLHLGPGLANGISNLHNARKARSPVVTIVGEHSAQHLAYDAPLTADIEALARPVSSWVGRARNAGDLASLAAACVAAAYGPPGGVATLIVPADATWTETGEAGRLQAATPRKKVDEDRIRTAAALLRQPGTGLLLSGIALQKKGLSLAARIQAATGAPVFANRYAGRLTRGRGVFAARRIPYFPEPAWQMLGGVRTMISVEAAPPVSFFGYPGMRSSLAPEDCRFFELASEKEDALDALLRVAGDSPPELPAVESTPALPGGDGAFTLEALGQTLAALLPEDAIVSDEMVSSGEAINVWLASAARHELLPVTGGSIGQGLPVALGAALACPERKVVALDADGSGMSSLQALWTMARERADVVVVILANRRYRILDVEMARTGSGPVGPRANEMLDLRDPELGWVALANGMGVEAVRAGGIREFRVALEEAFRRRGPFLIEATIEPQC